MKELNSIAPPVPPLEALRRNLLYAMLKNVSQGDMGEIVQKQVEKAKAGDTKSARLIIDMVQAGTGQERSSRPVTMTQAVLVGNGGKGGTMTLNELRLDLVRLLVSVGPMHLDALMNHYRPAGIVLPRVTQALERSPWFELEKDGWHLTPKARQEVLEEG